MHLKNWSFIYYDNVTPTLAPAYDYVATHFFIPHDGLALNFGGEKDFKKMNRDHVKRFSEKAHLSFTWVDHIMQDTISNTMIQWQALKSDFPLNKTSCHQIEKHMVMMAGALVL